MLIAAESNERGCEDLVYHNKAVATHPVVLMIRML